MMQNPSPETTSTTLGVAAGATAVPEGKVDSAGRITTTPVVVARPRSRRPLLGWSWAAAAGLARQTTTVMLSQSLYGHPSITRRPARYPPS